MAIAMVMPFFIDPDLIDKMPSVDRSAGPSGVGPVEQALRDLPDDEFTVVEMVVFSGMTLADAGRVVGVSRQQAHRLWNRAIVKLRNAAEPAVPGVPAAS